MSEKDKNKERKYMLKKFLRFLGIIVLFFIIIIDFMFLYELKKSEGNVVKAGMGMLEKVADSVTKAQPIYAVILGVNNDLGQNLADTIICAGYNPQNRKSFFNFNSKRYFCW